MVRRLQDSGGVLAGKEDTSQAMGVNAREGAKAGGDSDPFGVHGLRRMLRVCKPVLRAQTANPQGGWDVPSQPMVLAICVVLLELQVLRTSAYEQFFGTCSAKYIPIMSILPVCLELG
jgi:hypothetical protein